MEPITTSNKKAIAKNTIYMYIRMAITIAIGLYTSRVVLRTLGIEDYGIYNVVGGIVALFIFLNSALSQATQRFISFELGKGQSENLQKTFSMCVNVHVIIAVVIVLLAETVGLWLVCNKLVIPESRFHTALYVYQFSVLASVISITQVPYNSIINAYERFNVYAAISIFDAVVRLCIVLALPSFSGDLLLWYGAMILGANFIQTVIYRVYCFVSFQESRYKYSWDKNLFNRIMGFTTWSLFGNVADTLADQGVNILLNLFFGPAINAARGIAVQVKTNVAGFVYNFQGVSYPQIVKLYANNRIDELNNLIIKTSKISFFLFLAIMLPVCVEIRTILSLWLGTYPDYLEEFCVIILSTILCQSLGGTLQAAIQATGNIKSYQIIVGGFKLVVLPVSYILLKFFIHTPVVPLVVIFCVYGAVVVINLFITRSLIPFSITTYVKKVVFRDITVLLLSLTASATLFALLGSYTYRWCITIPFSILSVLFFSYYIGFDKSERLWIIKTLLKR